MRRKVIVAAIAALFSGLAFAAGDTGSTDQQSGYQSQTGTDQQVRDEGGAAARDQGGTEGLPATEHQREAVGEEGAMTQEVTQRFEQLDADRDGKISYDEAQAMPALKDYWDQQGKDKSAQMDQSEFAQFESQLQTGTDRGGGPEGLPATEHQKEAVEGGKSPAAPDSGAGGGMENRSDQYSR